MTSLHQGASTLRLFVFLFLTISLFAHVDAKKSGSDKPKGGSGSGGGGDVKGKLTTGKTQCLSGRNRCMHAWEGNFAGVDYNAGSALCEGGTLASTPNQFQPVCQLSTSQTDKFVLYCDGAGSSIKIIYDGTQASATTSGAARATFSSSAPSKSALKSGTFTSSDPNMDLWAFCYDTNPLKLVPTKGKSTTGTVSCKTGQDRCVSLWQGDFFQIIPAEGAQVCSNNSPTPSNQFVATCSVEKAKDVRYLVQCEQSGDSMVDVTYDSNGKGKATSTGEAKAAFAQSTPSLQTLGKDTVVSTTANENLFVFCPDDTGYVPT